MKFPCNSFYSSVYQGVDMEMHIVDHCNLNCVACNHFSSIAKPWFIDVDDFKAQMLMLKDKVPTLNKFMILGGEPTLHPKLLELCQIFREIFGNKIRLEVLTNGVKLDLITNNIQEYKKANVRFRISQYSEYIPHDSENISKLIDSKLGMLEWGKGCFTQTLVDIDGTQDQDYKYFKACHHRLPCFTLKDYKIYVCPFAAHLNIFCDKFNYNIPQIKDQDYLSLETLTLDKLEDFCYKSKPICKYCKNGGSINWQYSSKTADEFIFNLNELYFKNYDLYLKFKNNNILNQDSTISSTVDMSLAEEYLYDYKYRYNNKLDIIVPYYNITQDNILQFIDMLKSQQCIDQCYIYFVDAASNNGEVIAKTIIDNASGLNYMLLKTAYTMGPGLTRNYGFDNSYNQYVLFQDVSDSLYPNSIQSLLNKINNYQYDFIQFYKYKNDKPTRIISGIYRRKFLIENNLKYTDYPIYEDALFSQQANDVTINKLLLSLPISLYNYFDGPSISNSIDNDTKFKYKEIVNNQLFFKRRNDFYGKISH